MSEKINPTPTANKMLTIICNHLLISRDALSPTTTFEDLHLSPREKEELLRKISDRFLIPTEGRLLQLIKNGKYEKDTWQNTIKKIKTIWNILEFIEGNDGYNGKPAAHNLQ